MCRGCIHVHMNWTEPNCFPSMWNNWPFPLQQCEFLLLNTLSIFYRYAFKFLPTGGSKMVSLHFLAATFLSLLSFYVYWPFIPWHVCSCILPIFLLSSLYFAHILYFSYWLVRILPLPWIGILLQLFMVQMSSPSL